MGCQNWLHLCPSNILILNDGLGGVIRFISSSYHLFSEKNSKQKRIIVMEFFFICHFRQSRWFVIFQFSVKDHKYDSMKICLHKMPKRDVRYEAYVGVITAFFAYLISKSIRNIHCNRPIVPNNSPLVGMGNPPAGCIVTN